MATLNKQAVESTKTKPRKEAATNGGVKYDMGRPYEEGRHTVEVLYAGNNASSAEKNNALAEGRDPEPDQILLTLGIPGPQGGVKFFYSIKDDGDEKSIKRLLNFIEAVDPATIAKINSGVEVETTNAYLMTLKGRTFDAMIGTWARTDGTNVPQIKFCYSAATKPLSEVDEADLPF